MGDLGQIASKGSSAAPGHPARESCSEWLIFQLVALTPCTHGVHFCTSCTFEPHFCRVEILFPMPPSFLGKWINRNMGTFERSWNKAESNVSCFVLRSKCFQCLGSFFYCRPHIPVSKLVVSESYDTYISRSFQVTKEIISECKSKGRCYLGPYLNLWSFLPHG